MTVFSLDIGTRTVIGIVGEYDEKGNFNILSSVIKEHGRRNMYDGQIHDIEGVTEIVKEIKEELENELGIELKEVSIAAAGRSLKTHRVKINKKIDNTKEINKKEIKALELEAIQKAQDEIDANRDNNYKYFCIGYSVMRYYLDNSFMENLEGHRGEYIGVDLLATFLPQMVVESLYSVVTKAGLEVLNITLEPIAAINIAVKENLRLLNIALVDIGAGTSDIAISKDGTVIAYAMTSIAGDEITEKLAQAYLLDFDTSEELKINLNKKENHEFENIVGIKKNLSTEEILSTIKDVINKLAKDISNKIIEFNEGPPSAVFLIGGGSQIPLIDELIAENLKIPKERVVVKDINTIDNVVGLEGRLIGPDIITPLGIALEGLNSNNKNFIEIYMNNEKYRIFNTEDIRVSDVLILTGYNPRKLIPESGKDLIFYFNKERKVLKGELGEPAKIYVNNKEANLSTKLNNNDIIEIIDGKKGKDRIVYLKELFDILELNFNDYRVLLNGKEKTSDCKLKNGDEITTFKRQDNKKKSNNIKLIVNGEEKNFTHNKKEFVFVDIFHHMDFDLSKPKGKLILKVNGKEAKYMEPLNELDKVEIYWEK